MVCICTYSKLKLTFCYRKTRIEDSHVIDFQSKPIMLLFVISMYIFIHIFQYCYSSDDQCSKSLSEKWALAFMKSGKNSNQTCIMVQIIRYLQLHAKFLYHHSTLQQLMYEFVFDKNVLQRQQVWESPLF